MGKQAITDARLGNTAILWDPNNPVINQLYHFNGTPIMVESVSNQKKRHDSASKRKFTQGRLKAISLNGFVFTGRKQGAKNNKRTYTFVIPQ